MTMAKNKKKKMSAETKENLKYIFGSLVSNNKCIEGARHNPWWVSLIFFILAVLLPVVPIITSGFSAYGSSIFASRTFGMDTTITDFALDLQENDIKLMVYNGVLDDIDNNWEKTYGYNDTIQYSYLNNNSKQYDLLVYYTETKGNDFTNFVNHVVEKSFVLGSTTQYVKAENSEPSSEAVTLYKPNYVILNPEMIYVLLHKTNASETVGTIYGDFSLFTNGTCLKEVLKGEGYSTSLTHSQLLADNNYCKEVFGKFKSFLDTSFINNRNRSTLYTSLLAAGIYVALGFFMGLMVFILTRGKRNYYSVLNFIDCQKINSWAMFTPGLLALILGFMIPSYAIMFFIILVGLRVMWMSMKQLRPTY